MDEYIRTMRLRRERSRAQPNNLSLQDEDDIPRHLPFEGMMQSQGSVPLPQSSTKKAPLSLPRASATGLTLRPLGLSGGIQLTREFSATITETPPSD
jgi:hypothetical protein